MEKRKTWLFPMVGAALLVWTVWANRALMVNTIRVSALRLPDAFFGFRIAQVSDLHNTEFGEKNEKLLHLLQKARPDIIVVTGDLLDSRDTDAGIALTFMENAMQIAPVYYVMGNHEARIYPVFKLFETRLKERGVRVLRNETELIERNGGSIQLIGIDDPKDEQQTQAWLKALKSPEHYTVLLSHRPELFEAYAAGGMDLVFCGHAHGGQFRLPGVGGLFAPGQGFFPKYDAGLYTRDDTNMVVSRGLGPSRIPLRFYNRPEVVLVELRPQE